MGSVVCVICVIQISFLFFPAKGVLRCVGRSMC